MSLKYKGLNILSGKVKSLKSLNTKNCPNLGWKTLSLKKIKIMTCLKSKSQTVYILYTSYYVEAKNRNYITSTINFGEKTITTSIQFNNLYSAFSS